MPEAKAETTTNTPAASAPSSPTKEPIASATIFSAPTFTSAPTMMNSAAKNTSVPHSTSLANCSGLRLLIITRNPAPIMAITEGSR